MGLWHKHNNVFCIITPYLKEFCCFYLGADLNISLLRKKKTKTNIYIFKQIIQFLWRLISSPSAYIQFSLAFKGT